MNAFAPVDVFPEVEAQRSVSSFASLQTKHWFHKLWFVYVAFFSRCSHGLHIKTTLNNKTSKQRHAVFHYCLVWCLFPLLYNKRMRMKSAIFDSFFFICAGPPIRPIVYVNVLSGLSGPFITLLCVDANEASGHGNPVFPKGQQPLAADDFVNLRFINKQKLMCLWPENLKVMRPTLAIWQARSRSVRATVGVIRSGAMDSKPAWGCSSVLVTKLASLVTVQMTGALVKDSSPPVESQVSSQIGYWPLEHLWSWGGRVGEAEDEDGP